MRISDWSSDVCSSDLRLDRGRAAWVQVTLQLRSSGPLLADLLRAFDVVVEHRLQAVVRLAELLLRKSGAERATDVRARLLPTSEVGRSEEHTSELQSLMRISYAVFFLKKKNSNKS